MSANYTFMTEGTGAVTLTMYDGAGRTASDSFTVNVSTPVQPNQNVLDPIASWPLPSS
jgi:hypothetical protein